MANSAIRLMITYHCQIILPWSRGCWTTGLPSFSTVQNSTISTIFLEHRNSWWRWGPSAELLINNYNSSSRCNSSRISSFCHSVIRILLRAIVRTRQALLHPAAHALIVQGNAIHVHRQNTVRWLRFHLRWSATLHGRSIMGMDCWHSYLFVKTSTKEDPMTPNSKRHTEFYQTRESALIHWRIRMKVGMSCSTRSRRAQLSDLYVVIPSIVQVCLHSIDSHVPTHLNPQWRYWFLQISGVTALLAALIISCANMSFSSVSRLYSPLRSSCFKHANEYSMGL